MSEMTREQGHAHCIELLSRGDPAYKPRVLARQFLTHYDGRRPSDEDVARLTAEWMAEIKRAATALPVAYKNPPWWDGDTATRPVRCIDCKHCPERAGARCEATGSSQRGNAYWRRCESYQPHYLKMLRNLEDVRRRQAPIATIRAALAEADLLRFVAELRDVPEGRVLRLRHGVPEQQRFELYRLAGLRVIDNDPAIIAKAIKGHRQHGGSADESDPAKPETRAA